MSSETSMISLFQKYQNENAQIIWLDNRNREPVAAIYMDRADLSDMIISTTKTAEKYYIFINGIAVFFSYYRIIRQGD